MPLSRLCKVPIILQEEDAPGHFSFAETLRFTAETVAFTTAAPDLAPCTVQRQPAFIPPYLRLLISSRLQGPPSPAPPGPPAAPQPRFFSGTLPQRFRRALASASRRVRYPPLAWLLPVCSPAGLHRTAAHPGPRRAPAPQPSPPSLPGGGRRDGAGRGGTAAARP